MRGVGLRNTFHLLGSLQLMLGICIYSGEWLTKKSANRKWALCLFQNTKLRLTHCKHLAMPIQFLKISRSRWLQLFLFLVFFSAIFYVLPRSSFTNTSYRSNINDALLKDTVSHTTPSAPHSPTLGFDRIYVINIATRTDRRKKMIAIASYLHLNFTFISATLTNDPTVRALHITTNLKRVVLACYRSHMSVYEEIVAQNLSSALIFEDDIDVEADLEERIQELIPYMPEGWEMMYLGNCNPRSPQESDGEVLAHPDLRKSKLPYCLHSYAVSNKGAHKLLELMAEPTVAVDVQVARNIAKGNIESVSVVPVITTQTRDTPSDISKNWEEMRPDPLQNSVLKNLKELGLLNKADMVEE